MRNKHVFTMIVAIFTSFLLLNICAFLFNKKSIDLADDRVYATPQEAVELGLETSDYGIVQSGNTCLVDCKTSKNNYACQYLYKNADGWYLITDYIQGNPYFAQQRDLDEYTIIIRQFNEKYLIYVSQSKFSIEKNGMYFVSDNLNTNMSEMDYTHVYKQHYWYWCLDDIPKGYKISINGEVVYSKK